MVSIYTHAKGNAISERCLLSVNVEPFCYFPCHAGLVSFLLRFRCHQRQCEAVMLPLFFRRTLLQNVHGPLEAVHDVGVGLSIFSIQCRTD